MFMFLLAHSSVGAPSASINLNLEYLFRVPEITAAVDCQFCVSSRTGRRQAEAMVRTYGIDK